MERIYYISVPLNKLGVNEYDHGEDTDNIKSFELDENEYINICMTGIFDEINNKCNLLIDDYESEIIDGKDLKIALEIAENNNCKILIKALNLAIKYNTFVGLDF